MDGLIKSYDSYLIGFWVFNVIYIGCTARGKAKSDGTKSAAAAACGPFSTGNRQWTGSDMPAFLWLPVWTPTRDPIDQCPGID